MMWELKEAVDLIQEKIEPTAKARGLHVLLWGSVLYKGHSSKDLDIMVCRHNDRKLSYEDLRGFIELLGWSIARWRPRRYPRFVAECTTEDGRRVDVFGDGLDGGELTGEVARADTRAHDEGQEPQQKRHPQGGQQQRAGEDGAGLSEGPGRPDQAQRPVSAGHGSVDLEPLSDSEAREAFDERARLDYEIAHGPES